MVNEPCAATSELPAVIATNIVNAADLDRVFDMTASPVCIRAAGRRSTTFCSRASSFARMLTFN
jgi:hypothetical protein